MARKRSGISQVRSSLYGLARQLRGANQAIYRASQGTSKSEMAILDMLSSEQREAVRAPEPYVRVVAAAGAGKTETLTRRILFLLAHGADPASIVAFTFTERAAGEMKERLYRRAEKFLEPGLVNRLGDLYVGTIHAFCARLLQDYYGFGNFTVLDENQEAAFLMQHGWELGLGQMPGRYSDNCLRFLESEAVVCNELLDLSGIEQAVDSSDSDRRAFPDRVRRYWQLLDGHRLLTFGRLVRLAVEKLRKEPVSLPYRHLIVDEFQDINPAQEELIYLLARREENESCFVVGDPRQCIYEWRGSDPGCFERFAREFTAATYPLSENRRSSRAVIDAANRVGNHFESRELRVPMRPQEGSPAGLAVRVASTTPSEEAHWVAGTIRAMVDAGVCRYRDIAVLLRSVSTSGGEFTRAFDELGVPYLVGGKIGLFRRPEAEALACLWVWCAGLSWRGADGQSYQGEALLDRALALWPSDIPEEYPGVFRNYLLGGRYHDLIEALYDLLNGLGIKNWDPISDPQAAVRLANLARFSKVLGDFQAAYRRGGRRARWETLVRNFGWYLIGYASSAYAEQLADPAPDADAVFLSTVHQAKGLEWPVVFVPALVRDRFPSSRAGRPRDWLLPRDLFDATRYEGGVEAERKLFFVAATRARDILVLSRFTRMRNHRSPSPFLDEAGLPEYEAADPSLGAGIPVRPTQAGDENLYVFSVGDIISYLRCPHQYRLRNVWGYEAELHPDIGFGRSLHHVLRVLAERVRTEGVAPLAVLEEVMDEHFHLPFRSRQDTEAVRRRVLPALRTYLSDHPEVIRNAAEAEARLEFLLDGQVRATLSGRVDVLMDAGSGRLEVVDYKTARDENHTDEEASLQVSLYALGLRRMGEPVAGARIDIVTENRVKRVPIDAQALSKVEATARAAVQGITRKEFGPRPGQHACNSCDVRAICRWTAVTRV